MKPEKIKTYDDVTKYAKRIGYKNLTDEDIAMLRGIINRICDERLEKLKNKKLSPQARLGLRLFERSIAASKIDALENCTPERRYANAKRLREAIENVQRKEAEAYERARNHILF